MRRLASLGTLILLGIPFAPGSAQAPPGKRLTVDIDLGATSMRGDTTHVTYLVTNRATSAEQLFQLIVEAPAPVTWIPTPVPDEDWATGTKSLNRAVASWAVLGEQMQPGSTSPQLSFEAVGLAGLVSAWVQGDVPPPVAPPPRPDSVVDTMPERPIPDLYEGTVQSTTVGVDPFPVGMTTTSLIARLDSLTARTCGDLAWISASTTCSTLRSHLSTASGALAANNDGDARTAMLGYIGELDSSHSPPAGSPTVKATAYWLLRPNATFVLGRIPPP